MTTTETTTRYVHPLDPDIDTTPPAWLNMDVIWPDLDEHREQIAKAVREGAQILYELQEYLARVLPLYDAVISRAWLHGVDEVRECPDGLPDILQRVAGADALRDLLMALDGMATEHENIMGPDPDRDPTDRFYVNCLGRFGVDPARPAQRFED